MKLVHRGQTYDVAPDGRVYLLPTHSPPGVRIEVEDPELRNEVWEEHQRQMQVRWVTYTRFLGEEGGG